MQVKIHAIANKRYEKPVLEPIRRWIEVGSFLILVSNQCLFPCLLAGQPVHAVLRSFVLRWFPR